MTLSWAAFLILGLAGSIASGAESPGFASSDTPIVIREPAPPDTSLLPALRGATSFPRLLHWTRPSRLETASGDTLAHFMVCQLSVDEMGRPDTVRVLGCEGAKDALCGEVIRALRSAQFLPAMRGDRPVTSTCVFGVAFPAGQKAAAEAGIPVVGFWEDSLCAYDGRIYGSAELPLDSRPLVTRRVRAAYPEQGRKYPAIATVKLRAVVGPEGVPCFVLCQSAVPADRGFVEAAVAAAFRFKYRPGRLNGRPQAVWVDIDFRWDPRE